MSINHLDTSPRTGKQRGRVILFLPRSSSAFRHPNYFQVSKFLGLIPPVKRKSPKRTSSVHSDVLTSVGWPQRIIFLVFWFSSLILLILNSRGCRAPEDLVSPSADSLVDMALRMLPCRRTFTKQTTISKGGPKGSSPVLMESERDRQRSQALKDSTRCLCLIQNYCTRHAWWMDKERRGKGVSRGTTNNFIMHLIFQFLTSICI